MPLPGRQCSGPNFSLGIAKIDLSGGSSRPQGTTPAAILLNPELTGETPQGIAFRLRQCAPNS